MTNRLENQLCFLLYVSSKELIRKYTVALKPFQLTYTGYITLLALNKNPQSVKEVGQKLFLDSGTLTPLLKKLEQVGYVTRQRSKIDERQMDVSLTVKGLEVQEQLPCIADTIAADTNLTLEQAKQMQHTLQQFISTIQ